MEESVVTQRQPTRAPISEVEESEEDNLGLPSEEEIRKQIPQSSFQDFQPLKSFPPKLRNAILRIVIGSLLIFTFTLIIFSGPVALICLIVILQMMCFNEVIKVGYVVYRSHNLPFFRVLSWYFLFAFNYYLHGDVVALFLGEQLNLHRFFYFFVHHHQLVCFFLYISALIMFIMSLVKKRYTKQFTLFGYTHVALMIISFSNFQIKNVLNGLIWFVLPVLMIIVNDIMSYFVGLHLGRTPLIKLSPKKTWEGFLGGFVFTLVFSVLAANFMAPYDYFICPVDQFTITSCHRPYHFELEFLRLPRMFGGRTVSYYPFTVDAVLMALFASLIAPFGGFFASGFKRAFRLKDFGQILPGHGGVLDRFDCQFLMGGFVCVYYNSFINCSTDKIFKMILYLSPEEQLLVYHNLTRSLTEAGYLN